MWIADIRMFCMHNEQVWKNAIFNDKLPKKAHFEVDKLNGLQSLLVVFWYLQNLFKSGSQLKIL